MLLQEFVLERIRPHRQLYDLTDEDYKDSTEKVRILQKIADEFNSVYDVMDSDGKKSRPNLEGIIFLLIFVQLIQNVYILSANDIKNVWMKLWRDFKDYARKLKIFKSGDGAKKGLDPKQVQLMKKMNGFQDCIPDLFTNTMSSHGTKSANLDKSIWQLSERNQPNQSRKRKVPPVSKQYLEREDKKTALFGMISSFKETIIDLTEQTKKTINAKTTATQQPLSDRDQATKNLRTSLSTVVEKYFIYLHADDRSKCFEEMLKVFQQ